MKIVTVPHPALRLKAKKVKRADQKLIKLVKNMKNILRDSRNPRGVALAAPQVNKQWRILSTYLPQPGKKDSPPVIKTYVNPVIVNHCQRKKVLGPDPKKPVMEGCLSIPKLYGPVPRFRWVRIEYQELIDGELIENKKRFDGFYGRAMQHEMDHLDGILFTDYSLEYDLPVYQEDPVTKKFVEIENREILELF